ncbi:MAG: hypothetical protein ACK56W_12300 [Pirellula sp.]
MESAGSAEKTFVPLAGWFPLVLVSAGVIVTPLLFDLGVSGTETQFGFTVGLIVVLIVERAACPQIEVLLLKALEEAGRQSKRKDESENK